jgi:hypothetical protein
VRPKPCTGQGDQTGAYQYQQAVHAPSQMPVQVVVDIAHGAQNQGFDHFKASSGVSK